MSYADHPTAMIEGIGDRETSRDCLSLDLSNLDRKTARSAVQRISRFIPGQDLVRQSALMKLKPRLYGPNACNGGRPAVRYNGQSDGKLNREEHFRKRLSARLFRNFGGVKIGLPDKLYSMKKACFSKHSQFEEYSCLSSNEHHEKEWLRKLRQSEQTRQARTKSTSPTRCDRHLFILIIHDFVQ
jgi:hypothetical protein